MAEVYDTLSQGHAAAVARERETGLEARFIPWTTNPETVSSTTDFVALIERRTCNGQPVFDEPMRAKGSMQYG